MLLRAMGCREQQPVARGCAARAPQDEKPKGIQAETAGRPTWKCGCDSDKPTSIAMHAGINPAIGPAIPISNNAARDGIGLLIRINAPSIPIRLGNGTKKGGVG